MMHVCSVFNLERQIVYDCPLDGTARTSRSMTPQEVQLYSTSLAYQDGSALCTAHTYTVVVTGTRWISQFVMKNTANNLADLLNGWNVPMFAHRSHSLYMTAFEEEEEGNPSCVLLHNVSDSVTTLFCDGGFVADIPVGGVACVQMDYLFPPPLYGIPSSLETPIVVPETIPVMNVTATLYRKRGAGYYTVSDCIVIPAGFYENATALVAAMNMAIHMRGERKGFIFQFVLHKGVLAAEASHKQPEPSSVQFQPLVSSLGLFEQNTLPLRTGKRMHFDAPLKGIICL